MGGAQEETRPWQFWNGHWNPLDSQKPGFVLKVNNKNNNNKESILENMPQQEKGETF